MAIDTIWRSCYPVPSIIYLIYDAVFAPVRAITSCVAMYESFYGLQEKPFNLTPNPRFLFLSEKHKEALAHLVFGIKNRSGFVMISGEIGTGKTTICRSLLRQVDPDTEVSFIFNPCLSPEELLRNINEDFGIESTAQSIRGLIDELNGYLLKSSAENKNCVLVIDEAQNLTPSVLEQIRLLSNLETETNKLLQIILLGQPELAENLELPELRQLNQRITARYHLKELDFQETLQYVAFRLRIAGARRNLQFTRAAVRAVYKYSGGTPRVINAVCDRALLVGYTREEHTITPRLVRQAIKEVLGDRPKARTRARRNSSWLRPKTTLFAAAVAAIAVVAVINPGDGVWVNRMVGVVDQMWKDLSPITTAPDAAANPTGAIAKLVENPSGDSDGKAPISTSGRNEVLAFAAIPDSTGENAGLLELGAAKETLVEPSPESPAALELKLPSRNAALKALLGAWKLGRLSPMPKTNTPEDLAQFAEANGLAYESLRLDLTELAAVNLPALARVQSGDISAWVALLGIRDRAVILGNGSAEGQLVPRDQFEDAYGGDAMIMWLDPTPSRTPLALGTRGPAVLAVQSLLNAFGFDNVEPTGVYGAVTQEAVRRIQESTGLQVDGVVGKQTRMVLTSWSRDEPTPSLGPNPFPIAMRSVVADGDLLTGRPLAREEAKAVATPPASVEANAFDVPDWLRNTGPVPGPN